MKLLKTLYLQGNRFCELPLGIGNLENLNEVSLEWFRYLRPPAPQLIRIEYANDDESRLLESPSKSKLKPNNQGLELLNKLRDLCKMKLKESRPIGNETSLFDLDLLNDKITYGEFEHSKLETSSGSEEGDVNIPQEHGLQKPKGDTDVLSFDGNISK